MLIVDQYADGLDGQEVDTQIPVNTFIYGPDTVLQAARHCFIILRKA